ncbi:hypothetical protein ACFYTF_09910 [Nocardia thailandica]|uniref:Uncharacterized protein n=1 Tax=Nocardia thailandica TaxID=257275 RepID=A0ABW6PLB4_9NOCA
MRKVHDASSALRPMRVESSDRSPPVPRPGHNQPTAASVAPAYPARVSSSSAGCGDPGHHSGTSAATATSATEAVSRYHGTRCAGRYLRMPTTIMIGQAARTASQSSTDTAREPSSGAALAPAIAAGTSAYRRGIMSRHASLMIISPPHHGAARAPAATRRGRVSTMCPPIGDREPSEVVVSGIPGRRGSRRSKPLQLSRS